MHKTHGSPHQRRYLPSISLLAAFEAVCRTGSTAAAARELSLTQGAVSRLVQHLEGQLDVQLFRRERRRLMPTDAAQAYARDIRKALDLVARASLSLRANPGGGTLSLAILPTFGTRWLAPRLPKFLAAHPGVTINIGTRLQRFDFTRDGFDAAIHFGTPNWPDAEHLVLFDESVVACASPDFCEENPVFGPADLTALPLLQLESRPAAWELWFAQHDTKAPASRGMLFDQFATMIQAAIHGAGVALLPEFLATSEIAEGRLRRVAGSPVRGLGSYYLVWPKSDAGYPPRVAFQEWLSAECAALR
jgi:LysR family glycine cleavage system transcriptional activator